MKLKSIAFAWLVAMHLYSSLALAWSAPTQWTIASGGNDHYYEAVVTYQTWSAARSIANALSYNGLPGHLVTINSDAENTFVGNNLNEFGMDSFWLGGFQDHTLASFSEPGGGWRWVTDEPWSYTSWFPGFPDEYQNKHQDFLRGIGHDVWDDLEGNPGQSSGYIRGYIVEFQAVPEPSAFVLAGLAFVGLLVASRHHRKS